ncbi:MAG: hypothetical protein ACREJD_14935 [Phycisphaerales bacterium]
MMRFGNVSSSILITVGAAALVGCAAQSPDVSVPAADYTEAFTAARDVLHSYRFTLDRIDARAGILTTQASSNAGFFTPWSRQESTPSQEWEDTIHNQQRRVEIVFTPELSPETRETHLKSNQARESTSDLLESPRNTNAHVVVVIERIYQFGWRPNTKSTTLTTLTENTQPDAPSRVEVNIADDPHLAGRIAAEIRRVIDKRVNAKAVAASSGPDDASTPAPAPASTTEPSSTTTPATSSPPAQQSVR